MPDGSLTIGFIGLGNMGAPMTARLIQAGHRVHAYDVSETARAHAVDLGAVEAATLSEAVTDADVVILMLPNSDIVDAVAGDDAFSRSLKAGALVIDMSSSEPLRTKALADVLARAGIRFIDAPVSGGVTGAVRGTLTIMLGCPPELLERVTPLLELLGRPVRVGDVGAGHAIKALNNLLSATHLWITSEAMVVGQKFGIDPEVMLSVFNSSSGRSGSTENKWPNFILTQTYASGFGLRLMLKDMKIAANLADELGVPSQLGEDAIRHWSAASESLEPTADHTEVARWIQQRAHDSTPE
ncbi:NAD(P)-dependent oxidoreductase [Microbacterium sp. STN6]|uniref:NAD(P)-dependent oxidoreductase n=1 Tax=Microbacterium sp. STN6 TaxID=2995588 RepID=UPI002260FE5D|nr:NAD(P)-dependent oxidoreductase [Microbacterium sp. STN6]MCX7521003.1 NAD(P)-dependent oxidoreductase [Microbacterium sp. STN6]